MLYSAELRWFAEGDPPPSVSDWFHDDQSLEVEARVDGYLVFAGSEAVGVKLRDVNDPKGGKFEVKAAVSGVEVVALAPQVHGRQDSWVKWSFGTKGFGPWVAAISESEPTWVRTQKERVLRKFDLDDGTVVEVPIDQRPDNGCNAELVELRVGSARWWTVGFESFGPPAMVRRNLNVVLDRWFQKPAPVPLNVVSSVSYAAWAANFVNP